MNTHSESIATTESSTQQDIQAFVIQALTSARDSYEQAQETALRACELAQQTALPSDILLSTMVLGSIYGIMGKHDQAHHCYTTVQQLCEEATDKGALVDALCSYARYCYFLPNYHDAIQYSTLGIEFAHSAALPDKQAQLLNSLGRLYKQENLFPQALECLHEALDLVSPQEFPEIFGNTLFNIGNIHYTLGQTTEALRYYERVLHLGKQENLRGLLAKSYNNIGILFSVQGQYAQALEQFLQSETYQDETISNPYANLLNNIGCLCEKMRYYDMAIDYHQRSLSLWQQLGDFRGAASSLHNMGIAYSEMQQEEQAEEAYLECLALCEKTNEHQTTALALQGLGNLHAKKKNYTEAIEILEQAFTTAKKYNYTLDIPPLLSSLGTVYIYKHQPAKALEYLTQALHLAKERNLQAVLAEVHSSLAELYATTNQAEKALEHFQQYHALDKEITAQLNSQRTQTLQIRHNVEQSRKEAEIYRLKNVELATTLLQLEQANNQLGNLINEKSELLNIVAHDLKNPINSIMMLANFLLTDTSLTQQEIQEFSSHILSSSRRMLALITNLLDMEVLESKLQNLPLSVCSIAPLLSDTIRNHIPSAQNKGITLHPDIPQQELLAYTEQDILVQVLDNLLSNAVKFSPFHSTIWITANTTANPTDRQPQMTRISIRDEGPGLSEADQQKLFQKFARLSAKPTDGEHSTGLGLFIAKRLIDALGGSIRCESNGEKGTTFTIELPTDPPHSTAL